MKSTIALWGMPANFAEWIKQDALFTLDANDNFVTAWASARPIASTAIELGANYTSQIDISAKGDAHRGPRPRVTHRGQPVVVLPSSSPRCAAGRHARSAKGCVEFALPMTATVGGRYKFLDANDKSAVTSSSTSTGSTGGRAR